MNKHQLVRIVLAAAMISLAAGPALAQESNEAKTSAGFCNRLTSQPSFNEKMMKAQEKVAAKRTENNTKLDQRRAERDEKLKENRDKSTQVKESGLNKLEGKATTDAQKAAVAKFKAAVDAATTARRTAVDAAMKTFRDGVDKLLAERHTAMDAAVKKYKDALNAAITKAKTDCAAGVDPRTVKANLDAATKAAKTQFETDRKNLEKQGSQIEALAKTRNEAVRKAAEAFKTAMEKAKAELKAAFPKTESDND